MNTIFISIVDSLRFRMKRKHGLTWTVFHLIYDENDEILQDYYFCSRCHEIYHLNLSKSGQCLKRHAAKCVPTKTLSKITDYLVPDFEAAKRRKIKREDKISVRDASIEFVVKDMRPISSINGEGMATLLSKMTYIGAKYGHITPDTISSILPSRQSVRYVRIIHRHFPSFQTYN